MFQCAQVEKQVGDSIIVPIREQNYENKQSIVPRFDAVLNATSKY
ncbi:hypothetical protein ACFX2U_06375 [Gilliamella apicola]